MAETESPSTFAALWHYRWMSLGIILVTATLGAAAGLFVAPPATAVATVALKTPPPDSVLASGVQGDASLGRFTAQRASFVTSDAVIEDVAERVGRDDITAIRRKINATPSSTSNTIAITAKASSAEQAVELAAAVSAAYGAQTKLQISALTAVAIGSIDETMDEVRASAGAGPSPEVSAAVANTLSELQLEKSQIDRSSALLGNGIEFEVAPKVDAVAVAGPPIREIGLGLILGLLLAATVAWLRADQDRDRTAMLRQPPHGS